MPQLKRLDSTQFLTGAPLQEQLGPAYEARWRGSVSVQEGGMVRNRLDFAIASKRYPYGVIALLSALSFHGLTTQMPHQVWMAIPYRQMPKQRNGLMRFVTLSEPNLEEGVETHVIEGVSVKIFSAAKTVADCFKFRNKIGLDVTLEAFRDFEQQGGDVETLWHYATINRVTNVMMPYLVGMGV